MRPCLLVLLLLVFCPLLLVAGTQAVVSLDLAGLDSFFSDTALVRAEAVLTLSAEFGLRMPINLTTGWHQGDPAFVETGLFLDYHPLQNGLHLSLSLLQVGVLLNNPYTDSTEPYFLNEMAVGWTIQISPSLVIDPRLVIRDPNAVFKSEYEELSSYFGRFPMVRFSLLAGWAFSLSDKEEGSAETLLDEGGSI
ncbi:MAG: hypothetical protein AB7C91_09105 [Sphaerochaeta sp.]|jgi:hypothetical protein|uniref:hypothetical protein n=1 Tax=Sphaerochaeta sp. TaxID=1972642 RepID=UPI002FC61FD8